MSCTPSAEPVCGVLSAVDDDGVTGWGRGRGVQLPGCRYVARENSAPLNRGGTNWPLCRVDSSGAADSKKKAMMDRVGWRRR